MPFNIGEIVTIGSGGYRLHCWSCHAFLSFTPERYEYDDAKAHCDGTVSDNGYALCGDTTTHAPHVEPMWVTTTRVHVCKKCGVENKFTE